MHACICITKHIYAPLHGCTVCSCILTQHAAWHLMHLGRYVDKGSSTRDVVETVIKVQTKDKQWVDFVVFRALLQCLSMHSHHD